MTFSVNYDFESQNYERTNQLRCQVKVFRSVQVKLFPSVSFQDLRPGKLPCPLHRDELNLGDIFLGVEFVMNQCRKESLDLHGALTVSYQCFL